MYSDGDINSGVLHNLTYTLILIPIGGSLSLHSNSSRLISLSYAAAGISGIAFLFGLCGAGYHRSGTVFMSLTSALALLVTLVAWVLEMVLFGIAHHRASERGVSVEWGNANWLVLGALVSLFVGFVFATCGIFGSYRSRDRY